jgi:hypothetical protein
MKKRTIFRVDFSTIGGWGDFDTSVRPCAYQSKQKSGQKMYSLVAIQADSSNETLHYQFKR